MKKLSNQIIRKNKLAMLDTNSLKSMPLLRISGDYEN
jgi:hypothetical protein